jgi:hypothetical protein
MRIIKLLLILLIMWPVTLCASGPESFFVCENASEKGNIYFVDLVVNSNMEKINVVSGDLIFSDNIEIIDIDYSNSDISFWVIEPTIDENNIDYVGGIFFGKQGDVKLFRLEVRILDYDLENYMNNISDVYLHNGLGTKIELESNTFAIN